jgi:catechol 2,3-dioxygenase-like lactoylglutathione lyase family enzyme
LLAGPHGDHQRRHGDPIDGGDRGVPDAPGDQHYAFLIDDARFDAARVFLEAGPGLLSDGDRTEFEAQAAWNARSLYFPGPDRSVLEVIARRDLPRNLGAGHVSGAKASSPHAPGTQPARSAQATCSP